jgi:ABC-type sugar transport system substrate-binding protein
MMMRRWIRPIALVLCAVLLCAQGAGCNSKDIPASTSKPIVLGYSQLGDESTWRTQNTRSVISAAKEAGIQIMFEDAMQKPENQIKAIRSFIAYKVDVIAFSPLVESGWDTVLQEAKKAGIPVIIVDRMIATQDPSLYRTAIISDFFLEGRRAGEFLLKKYRGVKGPINIVEIAGTSDSTPAIGRRNGFENVIKNDPRFQVIFSADGDFMLSKGREIMRQVLEQFDPDEIDVLYSHNDDMTFGAIEVMEEAGIEPGKDIVIISVDATQRIIDYLKEGTVNCAIECNPNSGPQVMELAKKIAAGEDVEKIIYIPEQVFDEYSDFSAIADRGY